MRRIYLASSWRNEFQPRIVTLLRDAGHDVYDFRNPASGGPSTEVTRGFAWDEIDTSWREWTPTQYVAAMKHPAAERGFAADFGAMQWADTCVVLQPCGPSAALEAGWCAGTGRDLVVHIPALREPDLMYKIGRVITTTEDELLAALRAYRPAPPEPEKRAEKVGCKCGSRTVWHEMACPARRVVAVDRGTPDGDYAAKVTMEGDRVVSIETEPAPPEPAQEETPNCPECHRPMTPIRDGEWSCRWGHSLLPNSAPVSPAPAQTEWHEFECAMSQGNDTTHGEPCPHHFFQHHSSYRCQRPGCGLRRDDSVHQPATREEEK